MSSFNVVSAVQQSLKLTQTGIPRAQGLSITQCHTRIAEFHFNAAQIESVFAVEA